MTIKEIAGLLESFLSPDSLSNAQLELVSKHLDLLLKWNSKINLTAVRSPQEIVQRHFGESFFAARQIAKLVSIPSSAIDVGSGAGFPGVPLRMWLPEIKLMLIESNQKKATFLREVIRALNFADTEIFYDRAESLTTQADLVTLRAVEQFDRVLSDASALVKTGGDLLAMIGKDQIEAAKDSLPNYHWFEPIAIPLSDQRFGLIGKKHQ